ncbi:MAG: MFS transporter [Actinomycetota bacterium]|nr:MFS transporter [Actinomycetota bacterium]
MRRLLLLVGAIVLVDTMFFAALTPLLPHYVEELGLSKASAGVLSGAYAAGAFVAAIPAGIVAARVGVKPTVLLGLALVAVTTVVFGFAENIWVLDAARFSQGLASSFSWTGALVWLLGAAPADRRGQLIGTAMSAAVAGALLGPVLGGAASVVGTGTAFGAVAVIELVLAAWAIRTPAVTPDAADSVRRLAAALRDGRLALGVWLVLLPAALFGVLSVLAPLRLDELGFGAVAIGATFLVAAALESVLNPFVGRLSDRVGRLAPLRTTLAASAAITLLLPWLDDRWLLAAFVVAAAGSFGSFWAPAMSMVSDRAEALGLGSAYGFALVNLAWAPGATLGSAGGGAAARATSDAVPYLVLAIVCAVTLLATVRPLATRRARTAEG